MSYDGDGSFGVSLLRDGELVFASGVVTAVPLGKRVTARIPFDLIREAEEVFKKHDKTFEFLEYPIEITVDDKHCVVSTGWREVGDYHVCALRGFRDSTPVESECVVLLSIGACHVSAAHFTTFMLDYGGDGRLTVVRWQS